MTVDPNAARYALPNPPPRADWLARRIESALEPDLPIVDAHHHLWDGAHPRYLLDDYVADLASGHRIEATIFVEAGAMYRLDGADSMKPVGEVEFANGMAAMSASGLYGGARVCAGIVAHANLSLGDQVEPVLDALERAGGGRLKGVRHGFGRDPDVRMHWPEGLLRTAAFREGFSRLQPRGLVFDAWGYHPQLADLADLLAVYPEAKVVVNHCGGRILVGRHATAPQEGAALWKRGLEALARYPNVTMKLGGLGMALAGFDFHERAEPPGSEELADLWRPPIETCLELFGADRCMFESNFPVDKASCSYCVLWNAFKRITAHLQAADRAALFHGVARRVYGLS